MEAIEISIEDILNMHRHWITKLYIEDRRTDSEILGLLQDRRFTVTLSQIHRCIDDWGLIRQELATASATLPEVLFEEEWEWVPSRSSPTPSYTPSDPGMMDLYSKKSLPSMPSPDQSLDSSQRASSADNNQKKKAPCTDRLKVTCHHGPLPSEAHDVETTLCHFPNRPTPLETYRGDEQSHEMLALGLDVDRVPLPVYRRAGQVREDGRLRRRPRKRNDIGLRKKKS